MKLLISEDFCTNTKDTREYLETCAKTISNKKKDEITAAYVQFKSLVIKGTSGKTKSFSKRFIQNKIDEHPSDWWDHLNHSGTSQIAELPIVHEPVIKDTVDDSTEVDIDGKAVSDPAYSQQDSENAPKEHFQDAVDTPIEEAASSTTTDEVYIP